MKIQKRTKPDVRPVVAIGGEVGGGESPVTFWAYRDEWDGSYVQDRTPVSWSDQQLAENTERVRSGPAARAYENDRRAGRRPVPARRRPVIIPRRRTTADPATGGHQLRNPVPRWKRRSDARAAEKAARR